MRVKADDGNNGTATIAVTIEVEDVAEEATAQATFYPGTLSAGEVVTVARVALRLVPGLDRTVTVPLTTTHVGGATEADYEDIPSSVTFEPGETEEIFHVRAVNDDVDDDCEAGDHRFRDDAERRLAGPVPDPADRSCATTTASPPGSCRSRRRRTRPRRAARRRSRWC